MCNAQQLLITTARAHNELDPFFVQSCKCVCCTDLMKLSNDQGHS
jgi:hypothetical protein